MLWQPTIQWQINWSYILHTSKNAKFSPPPGWDSNVINVVTMQVCHLQIEQPETIEVNCPE